MRIDAHQHYWALSRGGYRWLTPALGPLYRDFGPADLAPTLRATGIDKTVLVQAADNAGETEYLLEIAAVDDCVAGVVGWVDFASPSAPEQLASLARQPIFVGVRPMIQDIADERWMLAARHQPVFRALVELGLTFDALVKPVHLPHLLSLLDRHPELEVVIDHGAKPCVAAGATWSGFGAWRDDLRALAAHPRVRCKLSGLVTEARPEWTVEDLEPFVRAIFDAFCPARVMWGSDWPVVLLAGGYERWWRATAALLAELTNDERRCVFGGVAREFYGLETEQTA